jgi:hypothetical protein
MPEQEINPCNQRLAVVKRDKKGSTTNPKEQELVLVTRQVGEGETKSLLLSHDCCCGICWNAHIVLLGLDNENTLSTHRVCYPITRCKDWSGKPQRCTQVCAYDPVDPDPAAIDPYAYRDDPYIVKGGPSTVNTELITIEASDPEPVKLEKERRNSHKRRYTWGSEINVDGAYAGWHGNGVPGDDVENDADIDAGHIGDFLMGAPAHIGVDFGEYAPPSTPTPDPPPDPPPAPEPPKRRARVFVRAGNLVYTEFACDDYTVQAPGIPPLPPCAPPTRPIKVMTPPTACIFNTSITDDQGRIRHEDDDPNKGLLSYRLFEPVYNECGFHVMGTDASMMYWVEECQNTSTSQINWYYMYRPVPPSTGFFDVRAAIDFDPTEDAGYWLEAGMSTVELGGAIYKLDADFFRYINTPETVLSVPPDPNDPNAPYDPWWPGTGGKEWAETRAHWKTEPPPFAKTKLLLPTGEMTIFAGSRYTDPGEVDEEGRSLMLGNNNYTSKVTRMVLKKWSKCACDHSCTEHPQPDYVYSNNWYTWYPPPMTDIICPASPLSGPLSTKGAAPYVQSKDLISAYYWYPGPVEDFNCPSYAASSSPLSGSLSDSSSTKGVAPGARVRTPVAGKCLRYDRSTGECTKYGTTDFNCDECEDSVSSPIII